MHFQKYEKILAKTRLLFTFGAISKERKIKKKN